MVKGLMALAGSVSITLVGTSCEANVEPLSAPFDRQVSLARVAKWQSVSRP